MKLIGGRKWLQCFTSLHKDLFEVTTQRLRKAYEAYKFQVEYVARRFRQLFGKHGLSHLQRYLERTRTPISGYLYDNGGLLVPEQTSKPSVTIDVYESSVFYLRNGKKRICAQSIRNYSYFTLD